MNDMSDLQVLDRAETDPPAVRGGGGAKPGHRGARRAGVAALIILVAALGYGAGRRGLQNDDVAAAAERQRDFVPTLRAAPVRPAGATISVTLPATTSAFEAA